MYENKNSYEISITINFPRTIPTERIYKRYVRKICMSNYILCTLYTVLCVCIMCIVDDEEKIENTYGTSSLFIICVVYQIDVQRDRG